MTTIEGLLVTPKWVAYHYGVSMFRVYKAIRTGKIRAIKVQGPPGKNDQETFTYAVDARYLPHQFPH